MKNIKSVDVLQLLEPGDDALHVVVQGLFNVVQHGLVWRDRIYLSE